MTGNMTGGSFQFLHSSGNKNQLWHKISVLHGDTFFCQSHFFAGHKDVDHIHTSQLRCVLWTEMNNKHTCDTNFSRHRWCLQFFMIFLLLHFYQSTASPLMFLAVHNRCIKLWWHKTNSTDTKQISDPTILPSDPDGSFHIRGHSRQPTGSGQTHRASVLGRDPVCWHRASPSNSHDDTAAFVCTAIDEARLWWQQCHCSVEMSTLTCHRYHCVDRHLVGWICHSFPASNDCHCLLLAVSLQRLQKSL